ncbi:MAG: hypothetical protein AABW81_03930 [Nanoarchaeota archaeon]
MKIIIKLGTTAIFDSKKQEIKTNVIESLARDVLKLSKKGNEVIIVTSGAVGYGKKLINGDELSSRQAQAAVGQIKLIQKYSEVFSKHGMNIAQFLLNPDDLTNKIRLKNVKRTYEHLKGKVIPIVNENDTTSTEELTFGDNDFLATELLLSMNFDILIILSEIGALIKDNKILTKSNFFSVEDYDSMDIPLKGFGGLNSKLVCAKKIIKNGKICIIARAGDDILEILSGKAESTKFNP